MTEKQFKEHYLKILNSSSIGNVEQREKIIRTEVQALADIDGILFETALGKIESIFIDQYFQDDEKVADQLRMAASGLMMMKMLTVKEPSDDED